MTPCADERVKSVIRALTDVIAPSLPSTSGLAIEQLHLSVAHLQILLSQLDQTLTFEQDELSDALALARDLALLADGGVETKGAKGMLEARISGAIGSPDIRTARKDLNAGIANFIPAVAADGSELARKGVHDAILRHEKARVSKDRQWFAPYGFDTL